MGSCHSSGERITLNFWHDSNLVHRQKVANSVPMRHLILALREKLCKEGKHDLDVVLQTKGREYTKSVHTSLTDLGIKNGQDFRVEIREKNSNLDALRIRCCDVVPIFEPVSSVCTVSELREKASLLKTCCGSKSCKVLLNEIQLEDSDDLSSLDLKTGDRISIEFFKSKSSVCSWRTKKKGLILKGICYNSKCSAYKQHVCINRGYGEFDIKAEQDPFKSHLCKVCKRKVEVVVKYGFVDCIVNYRGKDESGTDFEGQLEVGPHFQEFFLASKNMRELFFTVTKR